MAKSNKSKATETNTGDKAPAKPKAESTDVKRRKRVLAIIKELDDISVEYQTEAKVSPAGCIRQAVQKLNRLFKDTSQQF